LNGHQQVAGLCIPCPLKCTICQNHIERSTFRKHFYLCCQKRIDGLNLYRKSARFLNCHGIRIPNPVFTCFQDVADTMKLVEQQNQLSRLPTNLKVEDEVRQVRDKIVDIFIIFSFS
jgi:hypothetical protein